VNVQLLIAEAIRIAPPSELDDLGAEDLGVEAIRAFEIGDGDDNVVEARLLHDWKVASAATVCRRLARGERSRAGGKPNANTTEEAVMYLCQL